VRTIRNLVACVFFLLLSSTGTRPIHADDYAHCTGDPIYFQNGGACEVTLDDCSWDSSLATEDWESDEFSPKCTWFYYWGFNTWILENWGPNADYSHLQCEDYCPMWEEGCGTYGTFEINYFFEGMCPS
jgi:hypothetical protein